MDGGQERGIPAQDLGGRAVVRRVEGLLDPHLPRRRVVLAGQHPRGLGRCPQPHVLAGVGHRVPSLVRTQVGPIHLGDTKPGKMRKLNSDEVGKLYAAAGL